MVKMFCIICFENITSICNDGITLCGHPFCYKCRLFVLDNSCLICIRNKMKYEAEMGEEIDKNLDGELNKEFQEEFPGELDEGLRGEEEKDEKDEEDEEDEEVGGEVYEIRTYSDTNLPALKRRRIMYIC
jgi:hypothetical protein